jgi:hypothetical protein
MRPACLLARACWLAADVLGKKAERVSLLRVSVRVVQVDGVCGSGRVAAKL